MKTEFPEGKEYIIELFQDHYTALKKWLWTHKTP
jgi:hypothetical protein